MYDLGVIDFSIAIEWMRENLTVANVTATVAGVFMLTFLLLLPFVIWTTAAAGINRFYKKSCAYIRVFKKVSKKNIHLYNKSTVKYLPYKVRKAWDTYAIAGSRESLDRLRSVLDKSVDRSGLVAMIIYLSIYVLGVVICVLASIFLSETLLEGAPFLVGALLLGTALFVVLTYSIYCMYKRYQSLSDKVVDMIRDNVSLCDSECCEGKEVECGQLLQKVVLDKKADKIDGGVLKETGHGEVGVAQGKSIIVQDNVAEVKSGDISAKCGDSAMTLDKAKTFSNVQNVQSKVITRGEREEISPERSSVDELITLVDGIIAKGASSEVLSMLSDGLSRLHATRYMSGADLIKLSYLISEVERKIAEKAV